ncbi:hypothetical protein [Streptomyces sp. KL116D]|uniref:hypothetical protein n=1 Tax=Streptomyces sp. KL116D TaxID=3045152 RepID=UPI0035569D06
MTEVDGLKKAKGGVRDLVAQLLGVLRVVAAEGDHLIREHGGQQPDLGERDLVPLSSKSANGMPFDDVEHEPS